MELRFDDGSKQSFVWARPGLLSVQLWRPGNLRDGHGWLLQGSTQLDGEDLQRLVAVLRPEQSGEAAA